MKAFKPSLRVLACLFSLSWLFFQPAGQAQDSDSNTAVKRSLIRMDLLRFSQGQSPPFRRNIFAPGPAYGAPSAPGVPIPPVSPKGQVSSPEIQPQAEEAPSEELRPSLNVDLRYIGFIVSPSRLIALVILEGQAMAVAEGEVVSEGVRIGKISVDEIEVVLPDSSTRKFPLEGE